MPALQEKARAGAVEEVQKVLYDVMAMTVEEAERVPSWTRSDERELRGGD